MGDTLVYNAKIWTYAEGPESSWFIFNKTSGFITELGCNEPPIQKFVGNKRDYNGKRIFPGFHDAHLHLYWFSKGLSQLEVAGCQSVDELLKKLDKYVKDNPELTGYRGNNMNQDDLGRFPTKEELDSVCPDKPVLIKRICAHVGVANSVLLDQIGVDSGKWRDVDIERYGPEHPKAGQPTGLVKEDVAFFCGQQFDATETEDETVKFIKDGLDYCLKQGITTVHPNEGEKWFEYRRLAETDQLPIRVFYVPFLHDKDKENFPRLGEKHGPLLRFADRVKIFSDGSVGAKTAALSVPYVGTDNECGHLQHTQDKLNSLVAEATGMGFRLEIHVIGDAAVDAVLTAIEKAKVSPDKRPLLTHSQTLRPDLLERMKKCGAVANIQPQMTNTDGEFIHERLPESLLRYFNPWKSILNYGMVCSGGSDAPIEEPKPLLGIYDAIHRKVGDRKTSNKVFMNEERVSVTEAIDMYTRGGAFATMQEHRLGKLLPGYQADFVVIDSDQDPVEEPEAFLTAQIAEVWVAGQQKL